MHRRPDYRVGYTLDDNLQVVSEVRCYVTDGRSEWITDPLGQMTPFHISARANTWHSKNYFVKDDNHQIRVIQ